MHNRHHHFRNIFALVATLAISLAFGLAIVWLLSSLYGPEIMKLTYSEAYRQEVFSSTTTTLQDFLTLTLGIIVEALPFIVLGTLVATAIQFFISPERLVKLLPKNSFCRRIALSFMGVAMPVCECGNIPVARTLIARGVNPHEAIIFLLAAPSINIVTFIVTWEAFNFNEWMAILRVIATFVVANLTALIVAKLVPSDKLLTPSFTALCKDSPGTHRSIARSSAFFRTEMWLITRMLILGAMIAAASQTFVPQEIITAVSSDIFLSVLVMLALAFIISICSSVDAFFALAYVGTFSLGSLLAFLVAGPMVDIKMIALMKTTFTFRTLAVIAASVFIITFIIGVGASYVWG